MDQHTLTEVNATLRWHYDIVNDVLSFSWWVSDATTSEELAIGAAPGRHLYDLDQQALAIAARLAQVTHSIAGQQPRQCDPELPFTDAAGDAE